MTACFVTGSPMMEQLQPSGGTEKVFRIKAVIVEACYNPLIFSRKARTSSLLSLSHGPDHFRIEQFPLLSLAMKPHQEPRPGPITTPILYINEGLVVLQRPAHA